MKRIYLCIDLKTFYASVECVERGLDPFKTDLVVADSSRGKGTICLAISPKMKERGIKNRCRFYEIPEGIDPIVAKPRMKKYIEYSAWIYSIYLKYVSKDDIHVYSIDEAFIDVTSYIDYYHKTPMQIVSMIINEIKERTGLQATGGIGDNFFLAKVALDIYAKHEKNGIAILSQKDIKTKLWPITPLTKIWGIGERTAVKLNKMGIFTMGDLANANKDYIHDHFGIIGDQLVEHANGIDESDIHEVYIPKTNSISTAQVLFKDYNKDAAVTVIREMCDDLSQRLREENKQCEQVGIYIGYSKETMGGFARQMSLLHASDDTEELFKALMEIYWKYIQDYPIRRIGVSFGKLSTSGFKQIDMFGDGKKEKNNHNLLKTMDKLKDKYGKNILLRASALTENSTAIERHNQIGGHRK